MSSKYNEVIDDLVVDANAARPVTAGGTGAATAAAAATNLSALQYTSQTLTDAQKAQVRRNINSPYAANSGAYTAVADDVGGTIRFTVAATLSLTAAATLTSGWSAVVVADGGAVTIDPNGSETIDGRATIIVPNGSSVEIICDGSNFFTIVKATAWPESRVFSVSAAASIIVTDLASARFLRIKGRISQSATGIIVAQCSTDNGASYDTAANYFSQSQFASLSTNGASRLATTTGLVLSANGASDASSDLPFSVDIFDFNQAINCGGLVQSGPSIGSSRYVANLSVFHLTTTARNALRIVNASGGTITGTIVVEIMR
ncbi:MAG: hypothetical protein AAAB13_20525 [Pseudomonas sp.]